MFHRPSFSPVSFSRISFNVASQPVVQDGRSGYWRLFFTQLQEDSLKPDAVVAVSVDSENSPKPSPKTTKVKAKKAASKRHEIPETVPPFRPLPMFEQKPEETNFLSESYRLTLDLRLMVAQFNQIRLKFVPLLEAANDEDDVELLLLFA